MDVTIFVILLGFLLYQLLKDEKTNNELDNDLWERMY